MSIAFDPASVLPALAGGALIGAGSALLVLRAGRIAGISGIVGGVAAGLLVGIGARLGSGCTSGHAVCGISRLSPRSLVATGVFMFTAGLTVWVVRHGVPA